MLETHIAGSTSMFLKAPFSAGSYCGRSRTARSTSFVSCRRARISRSTVSDDPLETIRNSPEFQARERQREEARHRDGGGARSSRAAAARRARTLRCCSAVGMDLVSWSRLPSEVVDVLLRHVSKPYPGRVVEGIARALARPEARRGWPILALEFRRRASSGDADEGLAVALSAIADDQVMDELIGLAAEPALARTAFTCCVP